jgi:hypothetical protein
MKTPLLQSRRFWLLMLDTVIALIGFVATNYYPSATTAIAALIGILQPAFIAVIVAYTVDDVNQMRLACK